MTPGAIMILGENVLSEFFPWKIPMICIDYELPNLDQLDHFLKGLQNWWGSKVEQDEWFG